MDFEASFSKYLKWLNVQEEEESEMRKREAINLNVCRGQLASLPSSGDEEMQPGAEHCNSCGDRGLSGPHDY